MTFGDFCPYGRWRRIRGFKGLPRSVRTFCLPGKPILRLFQKHVFPSKSVDFPKVDPVPIPIPISIAIAIAVAIPIPILIHYDTCSMKTEEILARTADPNVPPQPKRRRNTK